MYDLGEFSQKGTIATKYGTKEDYLAAVKALQEQGIQVLCDVVLNHRMGADDTEQATVVEELGTNRNQDITRKQQITAWTKFNFRAGQTSTLIFAGMFHISVERTGMNRQSEMESSVLTGNAGTVIPIQRTEIMII